MNRALAISWFRYTPYYGEGYRILWEHWLQQLPLWAKEVDAFYLIDQDMGFTKEDEEKLKSILPNSQILKSQVTGHHWNQFKWLIPQIKEDKILFLDNDVVITEPGIVDGWFKSLEEINADFLGSFDGSGGMVDLIKEKYPVMRTLGNRMGSYYFILTKKLLNKIGDYTFEPNYFEEGTYIPELNYVTREGDWLDSFGLFTLKMLHNEAKMLSIPDPRQSIYLQPEGDQWKIIKDPETPENQGYYHIRNGNLANYVITSKMAGYKADYHREINSNKRELLRSLAWFSFMDRKIRNQFPEEILQLVRDLGAPIELWEEYLKEFAAYHEL